MKRPMTHAHLFPSLRTSLASLLAALATAALVACGDKPASDAPKGASPPASAASGAARPALTVTVTSLQTTTLPQALSANGSITAWQETLVGAEVNGLRLAEVHVNVGDVVKRGQVLASFAPATVQAELAQVRASVAEAEAQLADAAANAQRARDLQTTGALSAQQINQYLTAENTAKARLAAQRSASRSVELRLGQARVLSPDDGVISARTATVGAVTGAGTELFRLIRQGRLEWRAEVPSADLARMKPGLPVTVMAASGEPIAGRVRMVAPTVDPQTRNGIVYVDLVKSPHAKAGMFARGEFRIGELQGRTLPQSAVLLRDGFHYALVVGTDSKITLAKLKVGRRVGDRIEVIDGLAPEARVVAAGGGFLGDGDTVRVVNAPSAASAASAPKS
jgi:HlyD family secretion protein